MSDFEEVTAGLEFPEGPIWCSDGSIILVEIKRGTLTRVHPDGRQEIIAELGGGPNGAAVGPDGKVYVCNSGGFDWHQVGPLLLPGDQPESYTGGSIQRVDPATGSFETIYTECDGIPLKGPNDIVFDEVGNFWFTDLGKNREREKDRTGIFYASPDGSSITEAAFPLEGPNGIGLSPDGRRLMVAETPTGRVWAFDLSAPGEIKPAGSPGASHGGSLLASPPEFLMFDSLAIDAQGNTCVATIINGGITIISPAGEHHHIATDDPLTTNICFGGDDLRTAYITLSATGRLVKTRWETAGLALNYSI